jgi:sugar transferase (PEP-CTERM/EpsH1 system associated)
LAALEAQIPALFVLGAKRIHGEHGRDVFDIDGSNRKYNTLRRVIRPIVQHYVAVSQDLALWLDETLGVTPDRIAQIYNGVASDLFCPRGPLRRDLLPAGFLPADGLVVGTVGRLAVVKDQRTLILAFAKIVGAHPDLSARARLVIVGDGALRCDLEDLANAIGIASAIWFAGDRDDVADLMRVFDVFVLPSLGEGISNTILEAMATGLPVVATRVGGNPELVSEGITGSLVPRGDVERVASAVFELLADAGRRACWGRAARMEVERRFSWDRCVDQYLSVYDRVLGRASPAAASDVSSLLR